MKDWEALYNQLMETEKELLKIREERDYWEREAKKWCDKLGEIRILAGQVLCDEQGKLRFREVNNVSRWNKTNSNGK